MESNLFFYELPLHTPQLFLCVVGMGVWRSTSLAFEEPEEPTREMAEDICTLGLQLRFG